MVAAKPGFVLRVNGEKVYPTTFQVTVPHKGRWHEALKGGNVCCE